MFIEISELNETLNLDNDSVIPVVYQGQTKKVSFNSLMKLMKFYKTASYNSTTGAFSFGMSDNSTATLNTGLQESVKDITISSNTMTILKQDGTTEEIILPGSGDSYTKEEIDEMMQNIDEEIDDINLKAQ